MTNPHCAALKTAVAATIRPSLTGPPSLVSTVGNHFVITLPPLLISSLHGGPVTRSSSAGVAEDAVKDFVTLVVMLQPQYVLVKVGYAAAQKKQSIRQQPEAIFALLLYCNMAPRL